MNVDAKSSPGLNMTSTISPITERGCATESVTVAKIKRDTLPTRAITNASTTRRKRMVTPEYYLDFVKMRARTAYVDKPINQSLQQTRHPKS
jgi:hypothetical protein